MYNVRRSQRIRFYPKSYTTTSRRILRPNSRIALTARTLWFSEKRFRNLYPFIFFFKLRCFRHIWNCWARRHYDRICCKRQIYGRQVGEKQHLRGANGLFFPNYGQFIYRDKTGRHKRKKGGAKPPPNIPLAPSSILLDS